MPATPDGRHRPSGVTHPDGRAERGVGSALDGRPVDVEMERTLLGLLPSRDEVALPVLSVVRDAGDHVLTTNPALRVGQRDPDDGVPATRYGVVAYRPAGRLLQGVASASDVARHNHGDQQDGGYHDDEDGYKRDDPHSRQATWHRARVPVQVPSAAVTGGQRWSERDQGRLSVTDNQP